MNHLKQSFYKVIRVALGLVFALCALLTKAQLTGIKSVGSGGDYATIEIAINALLSQGVGNGGVTFNVAANHTEVFSNPQAGHITNAVTGTAASPVIFRKSGAGANPVITAATGISTTVDGIIVISGCDYITFDGIDLQENFFNTNNTSRMEWGYALLKNGPASSVRNATIKNCTITLNRANNKSVGIHIGNHRPSSTTELNITSAGTNDSIELLNNTVNNAYIGIEAKGYPDGISSLYDANLIISGNNISNFGGSSVEANGIEINGQSHITITGNTVSISAASTTGVTRGIAVFARTTGLICSSNTINDLSGTGAVFGISCVSDSTTVVEKNKVSGLRSLGTGAFDLTGIRMHTGICSNNLVGDLKANNGTSLNTVNGILLNNSNADTISVYFNTVYLACDSGGAGFGSNAIYTNTAPMVNLHNNIFVNHSAAGTATAYRRSNTTLASYAGTSNNNLFYANPAASSFFLFTDGTNNLSGLSAFQAFVSPRESASYSFLPSFLSIAGSSASFLHIDTGIATPLEGAGVAVSGITVDYDGTTRQNPPDIGADEFNGFRDSHAPVISYAALTNDYSIASRNVSGIDITDAGSSVNTVAGTRPRLYYKKSTDANAINGNTNATAGWKYAEANGTTSPFDFTIDYTKLNGGVDYGHTIEYFIVAQDQYGIPNTATGSGTFPVTPESVNLITSNIPSGTLQSYQLVLPNTITIGTGGFDSIAQVIRLLNSTGVPEGGITVNIPAGYREWFTSPTAGLITATGTATDSVIFTKSGAGTNPVLIAGYGMGSSDGIIVVGGGDYFTFDGLDVKDTSYNFDQFSQPEWGYAILKKNNADGAKHITIMNCNISLDKAHTSSAGIYIDNRTVSSMAPLNVIAGGTHEFIRIYNNTISNVYIGIDINKGAYPPLFDSDLEIGISGGNAISNFGGGAHITYGIRLGGVYGSKIANNIIDSSNGNTNYLYGIYQYTGTGEIIANHVSHLTSSNRVHGVYFTGDSCSIKKNVIAGLSGSYVIGAFTYNIFSSELNQNKVYRLTATASNGTTYGIAAHDYTAAIQNNMIGDLHAPSSLVANAVNGIYVSTNSGVSNVYHNTVFLDCVGAGAAFSSNALYINTGSFLDLRNNILLNNSTGLGTAVAYRRSNVTLSTYGGSSNNNVFYAGTPSASHLLFTDGSNPKQTLSSYQVFVGGRDSSSFSFLPTFLSTTGSSFNFLRTDPAAETVLESGGTVTPGITGDFDSDYSRVSYPLAGQTNGFGIKPDIGADEFDGIGDTTAPQISFTAIPDQTSATSFTLNDVSSSDLSGVNTTAGTKPRLYYKKSTDANTITGNTSATTGWKYVEADNAVSPFSFTTDYSKLNGGATFGNTIQYFIVAQDLSVIPNLGLSSGTFTVKPATVNLATTNLAGITPASYNLAFSNNAVVTVSATGGDFSTVAVAIAALNAVGPPEGGITFDVQAGHTETFPHATSGLITASGSSTAPIVFRKAGEGINPLITAPIGTGYYDGIIEIEGGDYITFDGIDLQEIAGQTLFAPKIEWGYGILKKNATDGAKNITIKNCTITLTKGSISTTGIYSKNITPSGTSLSITNEAGRNSNIVISGNKVFNVSYGIFVDGTNESNLEIINNEVADFGPPASPSPLHGIYVYGQVNARVELNVVRSGVGHGILLSSAQSVCKSNRVYDLSGSGSLNGIQAFSSISGDVSNNQVYNIRSWGTNVKVTGIYASGTTSNNLVMNLTAPFAGSSSTAAVTGIELGGGNLYHNTVYLACDSGGTGFKSSGLITINVPSTIRNNIIINRSSYGTVIAHLRNGAGINNYSTVSNNNLLYAGTPSSTNLLYTDGTNTKQTLAELKTFLSPRESVSISEDISFVSADSLRPAAGNFRLGASISGQTTDINGMLRSDPPDIGAYEGREPGRWIGGTSTNWNVLNNWDDSIVPVTAVDFLIDTNAVNVPILGANLQVNNLYIPSGKKLDLNGKNLNIQGAISGSGTIKGHPSSSITINGSGSTATLSLDQATPGSSNRLRNLTINRTGTITSGDSIQISGALTLTNGTFNTGGLLTLVSNSEGTAYIPELGSGAAISGNVKVERYIPSTARRWRFMSSPLSNATFEDWRSEIYLTGDGIGSTIGALNSNGFDASASNSPSVYWYNELPPGPSANGWVALTNNTSSLTNLPIEAGRGYRVFIRGDRSSLARLTGVDASQNSVTLNLTGPVNTGNIIAQVSCSNGCNDSVNDGWNLLGNPYPCPISWKNLRTDADSSYSNISPVIYIYDAVSNSYQYYNAFSDAGTISEGIIASGQAFYVQSTGQATSLTFKEKYKINGAPTQLFKSGASQELAITLKTDSINYDHFILKFIDSATATHDKYDANKMSGSTNISSYGNDNVYHSLDARPMLLTDDSITLHINAPAGSRQLIFNHLPDIAGRYFYLEDRYLQSLTMINEGLLYPFTIVSSIPATQGGTRFRIIISNSSTLPVTWLSLNAEKMNDSDVQLRWSTADQKNCSHFVIERAFETMDAFEETGLVNAGGKQDVSSYHFTDLNPFKRNAQVIFYRIRQVDHNGRFSFSGIAAVSLNKISDATGLMVFPVPANELITVIFPQKNNYPVNTVITDVSGKIVLSAQTESLNGKLTVHTGSLEPGIYFLRCTDNLSRSYTTTFIKQ